MVPNAQKWRSSLLKAQNSSQCQQEELMVMVPNVRISETEKIMWDESPPMLQCLEVCSVMSLLVKSLLRLHS